MFLSIIFSTERLEGDAEDAPAENPAERERYPAAETVSYGESGEEEKFVSVSVQTH